MDLLSPSNFTVFSESSENIFVDPKRAAEFFSSCIVNDEGREGFNSFFEKRKPYWAMEE